MEIDRFLAKPVEVEIRGVKAMIKPLTTEFYPLITKLSYYSQKILIAQSKLKEEDILIIGDVFTPDQLEAKSKIELEIAYLTLEQNFEGVTRETFKEMDSQVINEILEGAMKANGLTDEKLAEIKNQLMKNAK